MKKVIVMTFQLALRQKFQTVLDGYHIKYEKKYVYNNVTNGVRTIAAVHYIVDAADLAMLDMNLAMEGNKRNITYLVQDYA